jgi:undecaprenyl-diphosphatase
VIKEVLLGSEMIVVWALLVGGVLLILLERFHTESEEVEGLRSIRYRDAVAVGLFQALAIIPGVSRSGATIAGGLLLGMRRAVIVEFSFLLAVPTMLAATGYDILKTYDTLNIDDLTILLVGSLASFVVALLAVRFLIRFVKRSTFTPFGVYRILLALVFILFVL